MLSKECKEDIVKQLAKSEKDTGSCEVQIGFLSERIRQIATHLKSFPKDKHSRFGLVKLVSKRRSFFAYLKRKNKKSHDVFLKKLKDQNLM